jgi:hypothetical protein
LLQLYIIKNREEKQAAIYDSAPGLESSIMFWVALRLQHEEMSLHFGRLFFGGIFSINPHRLVPQVRLERTTYALGEVVILAPEKSIQTSVIILLLPKLF